MGQLQPCGSEHHSGHSLLEQRPPSFAAVPRIRPGRMVALPDSFTTFSLMGPLAEHAPYSANRLPVPASAFFFPFFRKTHF